MTALINTSFMRERIVTARKDRRCEGWHCGRTVGAGEQYLVCTEYPGGEAGFAAAAGHPVRLSICRACAPRKFEDDGSGGLA